MQLVDALRKEKVVELERTVDFSQKTDYVVTECRLCIRSNGLQINTNCFNNT
jgi:hypothetical protein